MSKSKKSSLDILGESHIPSDLLTPTLGSNYGLDGFEDMQYGMGVLEGVLDPQYTEAPALPTGVQLASAEELDLHGFLEEGVPLTDLSWLDPSQLQDPERLPKDPDSIPELEEAWGRSTDGVRVWERDLDDARREASLREGPKEKTLSAEQIRKIVSHSMRRSVQGHDINTIMKEALDSVGDQADRLARFLQPMKEEHGLHGKVFVRASAYPQWGTGKWSQEVKKWASRARYLIVEEKDLKTATWIEGGRCKYTSKIAVTEVPWEEALAHYKPLLESAGKKVAGGDPKRALQAAFLSLPKQARADSENRPVHITPDKRVSKKEAREVFEAYTPEKKTYDPSHMRDKKAQEKVQAKISQLVRDNLLPKEEARELLASGAVGEDLLQAAAKIATRIQKGTYRGQEGTLEAVQALRAVEADRKLQDSIASAERVASLDPSGKEYKVRLAKAEGYIRGLIGRGSLSEKVAGEILSSDSDLQDKIRAAASLAARPLKGIYTGVNSTLLGEKALREARDKRRLEESKRREDRISSYAQEKSKSQVQGLAKKVSGEIERGVRGSTLRNFIARTVPKDLAPQVLRELAPTLKKTGALQDQIQETRTYDQVQYTRVASEKTSRSVLAGQILKAASWVRKSMTEGFAGKDLDDLINKRLSDSLKKASSEKIQEVRTAHEGVSGFLYVDAEAYASPSGVSGCEQGALKHRANKIPSVLEMSRCGTCAMARVLEDGTRKCGVYNKVLANFEGEDLSEVRESNVRASNMTDDELTASYFSPTYDPSEFGLENNSLEGINLEMPENQKVSDVSFGDWDF